MRSGVPGPVMDVLGTGIRCDTIYLLMKHAPFDLLVVGFPEMAQHDRAWIEDVRVKHHPRHAVIAAHVTLVFPIASADPDEVVPDIRRQVAGISAIPFVLRCAVPWQDDTGKTTDVFLVPDEGFGAIVRLHDRLYAGTLAAALRLDIPFIPHLTIARFTDPRQAKRLADDLNAEPLAIPGTLSSVNIVLRHGAEIRTLEKLALG